MLTLLRQSERKAGLARRLADCLSGSRDPAEAQHVLNDIIRFQTMMIATGSQVGSGLIFQDQSGGRAQVWLLMARISHRGADGGRCPFRDLRPRRDARAQ